MGDPIRALTENYTCPKCRSHQAHAREVSLSKTRLFCLFAAKDNRYLEVTCGLCGYTEFYNRALYAKAAATEQATRTKLVEATETANAPKIRARNGKT